MSIPSAATSSNPRLTPPLCDYEEDDDERWLSVNSEDLSTQEIQSDSPSLNNRPAELALSESAPPPEEPPVVVKTAKPVESDLDSSASESEESDNMLRSTTSQEPPQVPSDSNRLEKRAEVAIDVQPAPKEAPPSPRLPWYKKICPCWPSLPKDPGKIN